MTGAANKLRGGYYTPREIARFICEWAISDNTVSVLEPSCGDGVFIEAATKRLEYLGATSPANQITGIELYGEEAKKAADKGGKVVCGDFFTLCQGGLGKKRFDVIVGNPPFIRYQDFDEKSRSAAFAIMRDYGFSPNKLTNIWLPFLVICCHMLSEEGKLGMVIPAELFQVKYAAEARSFLPKQFEVVNVITFTELLFDGVQQEVVLLLLERTSRSKKRGIRVIEAENATSLSSLTSSNINAIPAKRILPESMKWQAYYLDDSALALVDEVKDNSGIFAASDLFDVNVGVVSGQNSFFVINQETAASNGIADSCVPIISRSFQLDGLTLTDKDFDRRLRMQNNILLFLPEGELNDNEYAYVRYGETKGYSKNYKCRIRTPWYRVPTSWMPDAFFFRQVGSYPRIVLNEKAAHATDTLHKIRFLEGVDGKALAVAFNNSYTFLMSELMGRSYGGGVLTFEPSEARNLPIPFKGDLELDFERADTLVRQDRIEDLVDYVDDALLGEKLGMSRVDIARLNSSWKTLRDRRLTRKMR